MNFGEFFEAVTGSESRRACAGIPQFGDSPLVDSSPFADGRDPNTGLYSPANGNAADYLRSDSPFTGVGAATISPALRVDFARMTTFAPQLLTADITSSQTLAPVVPRDTGPNFSLGYHYPIMDYVVNGATVNNCTLNIDQGTVIGFNASFYGYEWGIRLNPGARLNVNGVPTNRVVFALVEAVQEYPQNLEPYAGEFFTSKGVVLPSGTPVTPFPEIHAHYADFHGLPGGQTVAFGGLAYGPTLDDTYDMLSTLELDGCYFGGGTFFYETGGPQGRSLTVRNSIFERTFVALQNTQAGHGSYCEAVTNVNNLFYGCDLSLRPVSSDPSQNQWTFTDNIFDQSVFHGDGPVAVNSYNAYVAMSGQHLSPGSEANPIDLSSLSYDSGQLGSFYLPSSATQLLGAGSRTARGAGLYHFTSLVDNTKQANAAHVNIGPAYLALDSSGNALDANADGVPDFIADRNGDGVEDDDEMKWSSANDGSLAILSPAGGATVSGIIKVRTTLGITPSAVQRLSVSVEDDDRVSIAVCLENPSQSVGCMELDTTRLPDGPHNLVVRVFSEGFTAQGAEVMGDSQPVQVSTANALRSPDWVSIAQFLVNVQLNTPTSLPNYIAWFFPSAYTKVLQPRSFAKSGQRFNEQRRNRFIRFPFRFRVEPLTATRQLLRDGARGWHVHHGIGKSIHRGRPGSSACGTLGRCLFGRERRLREIL